MKRKFKKIATMTLALLMGFTLVSCNNNDKSPDNGDSENSGGKSTESSEPLEFTLMSSIWGDHEKSLNDDDSNEVFDELQKRTNTNITFKWFPADQYTNRVTTTLSSGEIPEVINGAGALLIDQGAAVPLDDLLEEHGKNILASYEDNIAEATKLKNAEDGKTYMIPFVLDYQPAYSWMIREDWLNNVGIEKMPNTWDEWLNVWDKFKNEDANNDGNASNEIPYSGDIYSLMPIFGMNVSNRFTVMIDDDNNWTLAPETPMFKEFLEAVRDMYDKGYLDQEFAQRGVYVNNNNLGDAINAGLAGSSFTWAEITRTATEGLQEVEPEAKLVGIEPPVGPEGKSGIPGRNTITPTSVITVEAEDKGIEADLVEFFDYIFSEEGMTLMSYGIEGKTYEVVDGKPDIVSPYSDDFQKARQAGINFTPMAHNFVPEAYEEIMLAGKDQDELEPNTQIFFDALYKAEGKWFNSAPVLNTDAYVNKGTELFGQLGTAIAECVIDEISIDEFYQQYENLKANGLQEVIDEGNEAWQRLSK